MPHNEEKFWLSKFKSELDKQDKWLDICGPETLDNVIMKGDIPHGLYHNEKEIIHELQEGINRAFDACTYGTQEEGTQANFIIRPEDFQHVQLNFKNGFLQFKLLCDCKGLHYVDFSDKMKKVLGVEEAVSLTREIVTAPRPCILRRAKPNLIFVYCDICEPNLIGDTAAPLLRVVTLENSQFGCNVQKTFPSPQYHPLMTNNFQTIEVLLRDDVGAPLPFCSGVSSVTLHLRKKQRQ